MKGAFVRALAWDLVACEQRPPLHPTTSAIVRALGALGVTTSRELRELVGCDIGTLRQNLWRLQQQGVVWSNRKVRRGKNAISYYGLTRDGVRVLVLWREAHERAMQRVEKLMMKRQVERDE